MKQKETNMTKELVNNAEGFLRDLCNDQEFKRLAVVSRAINSYRDAKMHVNRKNLCRYMPL